MRKLKTYDIPVLCRCLKKMGIKEQFKNIAKNANNIQDVWESGFDIVWGLFDKVTDSKGEKEIYTFLAGPFEMTADEVRELDFDILVDNLKQLANENNLTAFFKNAAKLMK